jgi:hypothetical protein
MQVAVQRQEIVIGQIEGRTVQSDNKVTQKQARIITMEQSEIL